MSTEICYGFWGDSLIYVTRERLNKYSQYVSLIKALDKAHKWDELLKQINITYIEESLSTELDFWWERQNPESDRGRQVNELPDLDTISIYSLFEYDYIDLLDDPSKDPGLPAQIQNLATYEQTSPMTGYNPIDWDHNTLDQVQLIAKQLDFKLSDESLLIADLYNTFW